MYSKLLAPLKIMVFLSYSEEMNPCFICNSLISLSNSTHDSLNNLPEMIRRAMSSLGSLFSGLLHKSIVFA